MGQKIVSTDVSIKCFLVTIFGIIIRFLECAFSLAIGFFSSRLDFVYEPSFNKTKGLASLFLLRSVALEVLTWGSY